MIYNDYVDENWSFLNNVLQVYLFNYLKINEIYLK